MRIFYGHICAALGPDGIQLTTYALKPDKDVIAGRLMMAIGANGEVFDNLVAWFWPECKPGRCHFVKLCDYKVFFLDLAKLFLRQFGRCNKADVKRKMRPGGKHIWSSCSPRNEGKFCCCPEMYRAMAERICAARAECIASRPEC